MRFLYVFAFLFLAVFLLVTAAVGFGTVAATPAVANVISFCALVAGVLFFILVIKHLADKDHNGCCTHTHDVRDVEKK